VEHLFYPPISKKKDLAAENYDILYSYPMDEVPMRKHVCRAALFDSMAEFGKVAEQAHHWYD